MKYYFVTEEIIDGEHEYNGYYIIKAKNEKDLEKKAHKEMIENWGAKEKDYNKKEDYLDLFDRGVRIESWIEITLYEAKFLKNKLGFWIVD